MLFQIKNFTVLGALLLLIFVSCGKIKPEDKSILPKPMKVYQNADISLKAFDFDRLEPYLNQKNDTTYVFNFWATWCVPCVEELPHFEKLNQKFKDKPFKMILVSLDFPKMIESRLLPYIKDNNLKAEFFLLNDPDANTWIDKVSKNWSGAIPATLIYNAEKRKFYEQSFDYETLETEIKTFIN